MKNFLKLTLGAAVLAGGLGLGATSAQAAQVRVYMGAGDAAYIPPSPGPGYVWVAGYYNDGYWTPGYWNYVGGPSVVVGGRFGFVGHDGGFYRDRDDRARFNPDDHRGFDRNDHSNGSRGRR
jgi:hypothetical protein